MGALCLGLALTALGCAKGANTFDDTVNGSGGAAADPNCGDGVMQPNEQCDPKLATATPMTCMLMVGGTGPVPCNPITCQYDTSMCVMPTGVGGH